jgi:hypothetical protein
VADTENDTGVVTVKLTVPPSDWAPFAPGPDCVPVTCALAAALAEAASVVGPVDDTVTVVPAVALAEASALHGSL